MSPYQTLHIVTASRRGGKTRYALDWLSVRPNAVLFTITTSEQERLREMILSKPADHPWRGIDPNQILSIHSRHHLRGRGVTEIGVDNLDMVLSTLFGYGVTFATMARPLWEDLTDE
jgi:hypothetical protein